MGFLQRFYGKKTDTPLINRWEGFKMGAIRENNQCCQFAASQARDGKARG